MNQQQAPLAIGDIVEVTDDHRGFLNGRVGMVFDIIGNRASVAFEGVAAAEKRAVILLEHLKKVEVK
jgi:ribosomal protein L21E